MSEVAEILGVTERTFRRWSGRYDTEWGEGLQDRRLGRASASAVPVDEALRMVTLYESHYTGWTVKHFHERWQAKHGGRRSPIVGSRRPSRRRDRWPERLDAGRLARSGSANPCPA